MDPIEIATQYCLVPKHHRRIRMELRRRLGDWLRKGGFRPCVDDVGTNMDRTGASRPAGWVHDARDIGLVG